MDGLKPDVISCTPQKSGRKMDLRVLQCQGYALGVRLFSIHLHIRLLSASSTASTLPQRRRILAYLSLHQAAPQPEPYITDITENLLAMFMAKSDRKVVNFLAHHSLRRPRRIPSDYKLTSAGNDLLQDLACPQLDPEATAPIGVYIRELMPRSIIALQHQAQVLLPAFSVTPKGHFVNALVMGIKVSMVTIDSYAKYTYAPVAFYLILTSLKLAPSQSRMSFSAGNPAPLRPTLTSHLRRLSMAVFF
ncbi:hypothetical protein EDB19DRAFT_2027321 [Suillus lakei]|nr:hypothetical protein EDB19DRAFT_2027321 [Suillus lakei]